MSVPYRSSFEKVADNIYVNKNYSGNIKEAIQLTEEALERDRAFFGELQCTDTTIIIFCDDDKLLSKLDGDHDTKYLMFIYGEVDEELAQELFEESQSEEHKEHRKKISEYCKSLGNCEEVNIPASHDISDQKPEEFVKEIEKLIDRIK